MPNRPKVVAIVSGGMDSATLSYHMRALGWDPLLISFDYGQRHQKELAYAEQLAQTMQVPWQLVVLTSMTDLFRGSSLTDRSVDVPDGHYAEESMRATIVPNRNAIFLSIAYGYAASIGANGVAIGVHAGDHHIYPDCRPEFVRAFERMERRSLEGMIEIDDFILSAPFIHQTKAQIVQRGHDLGVPFEKTWSCYKGGNIHCGTCGTCVERREAFELAGVKDPTEYQNAPDQ